MVTEHTFGEVTPTYSPECDPQFEAWAQAGYDVIFGVIGHQWCFAAMWWSGGLLLHSPSCNGEVTVGI